MKKIICVLLAVAMIAAYMPTMAATVTFKDVEENNKFRNAIYTLADFGIILGDGAAGTFRPKSNITREEFSVIMTRVLGLGALNITVTDYPFTDVNPSTAGDWSIKATKIAHDLGIINGFPDGTFKPKANVTYEQAVKMIVCALGYEETAKEKGGWPNGYVSTARELGILNGAEASQKDPAIREIIAQLVLNSMEIPLADTSASENRNFLTEKLKYHEGTGVVTGIEGKALKSNASGITADEVQIDNAIKFNIGDTSAKEFFGKQIKYYYKEDNEIKTLVSARLTSRNSEVTVTSSQIKELYSTKLEYYPDPDDVSVSETYYFENGSGLSVIYNGKYSTQDVSGLRPDSGSIKLIDNNGNGAYDVLIIESTDVYVVSSVDSTNQVVFNEYDDSDRLELSTKGGDRAVKITKANTEVDFSQIKKGDVLLVSSSSSPAGKKSINVEIVTNTASGNVTAKNEVYGEVIIAGKTYEYSGAYMRYLEKPSSKAMNVGDKVTLYLDHDNKVLAASITSVATVAKYGYIVDAGIHKNEEYADLMIVTIDNKKQVLSCTERAKFNGKSTENGEDLLDKLDGWNDTRTNKDIADADKPKYAQLIKYTTNSANKIDNIYPMKDSGKADEGLVLSSYQEKAKYNSTNRQLGTGISLSTTTKVMFVPGNRTETDKYSVGTYSKLKNGTEYIVEAYDCSETNVPAIVVVYIGDGKGTTIGLDDPTVTFALVESIKDVIKDGETVTELKCKVDGSDKTYYATSTSVLSGYKKGDVLKVAFDTKGYVDEVEAAFDWDKLPAENKADREDSKGDTTNSYKTIYGTVYARDNERITISPYEVETLATKANPDTQTVSIASSTKIFVLDTTVAESSSNRLTTGTIDSIASYASSKTGASSVFAYIRNTVTRFILVVR